MGLRFHRRIKVGPFHINLSRKGVGAGIRLGRLTLSKGPRGATATFRLFKGLSYILKGGKRK